MPIFDLYRIRVIPLEQLTLFRDPNITPQEILRQALLSTKSGFEYGDQPWRIADVEEFGQSGIYLRVGRLTSTSLERLQDGHFTEEQLLAAVSTNLLIDIPTEVCAIAQRAKLSTGTRTIANKLISLLNVSTVGKDQQALFEISEITNPVPFLKELDDAEAILSLSITFSRPNHFDADKYIHEPIAAALRDSKGQKGTINFQGNGLDPEFCKDTTVSSVKLGERVKARLRYAKGQKPITRSLKREALQADAADIAGSEEKDAAMKAVLGIYESLGEQAIAVEQEVNVDVKNIGY